jgi:hypothetical protein
MPLSIPTNGAIHPDLIGSISITEVLYEAESPVVYAARSSTGHELLAYVADEAKDAIYLILAPSSAATTAAMKKGQLAVLDALFASWTWLAQLRAYDGPIDSLWKIDLQHFPAEYLPCAGTPLLPEHEPVISARAIGDGFAPGRTPASVVSIVATATRISYKAILDHLCEPVEGGRSREEYRDLYDFPVQRFAFNSFQIEFVAPDDLRDDARLMEASQLLTKGLAWAAGADDKALEMSSDKERGAILQAALQFTPPTSSRIKEIQVSGAWVSARPFRLTKAARKRVRMELRNLETEHSVELIGHIGEVDRDKLTCILRNEQVGEYKSSFDDELLDDMLDCFTERRKIAARAVERAGRYYISAIFPLETVPPPDFGSGEGGLTNS